MFEEDREGAAMERLGEDRGGDHDPRTRGDGPAPTGARLREDGAVELDEDLLRVADLCRHPAITGMTCDDELTRRVFQAVELLWEELQTMQVVESHVGDLCREHVAQIEALEAAGRIMDQVTTRDQAKIEELRALLDRWGQDRVEMEHQRDRLKEQNEQLREEVEEMGRHASRRREALRISRARANVEERRANALESDLRSEWILHGQHELELRNAEARLEAESRAVERLAEQLQGTDQALRKEEERRRQAERVAYSFRERLDRGEAVRLGDVTVALPAVPSNPEQGRALVEAARVESRRIKDEDPRPRGGRTSMPGPVPPHNLD